MQMLFRTWAEVSLGRIAENFHSIQCAVGDGVVVSPAVKANAYGHGAREVGRCLDAAGARWLAVSTTDEGVELRDAGVNANILVMGDFLTFEREAIVERRLTPVIHSLVRLRDFNRVAAASGRRLSWHLKVDTGMGRLGSRATAAELIDAVREAPHTKLEGLMTHFASASDFSSSQTAEQIAAFGAARAALRSAGHRPSTDAPCEQRSGCARAEGELGQHGASGPAALRLRTACFRLRSWPCCEDRTSADLESCDRGSS